MISTGGIFLAWFLHLALAIQAARYVSTRWSQLPLALLVLASLGLALAGSFLGQVLGHAFSFYWRELALEPIVRVASCDRLSTEDAIGLLAAWLAPLAGVLVVRARKTRRDRGSLAR